MSAFGAVIIGDELLTGRRQDGHLPHLREVLGRRGWDLAWWLAVGDDPERLTWALSSARARPEPVFCFGGIGATPDDCTRQAAAAAFEVPLARHPEAAAEIESRFAERAYPHRIRMADLPEGARLIPNPYNRVPGFSMGRLHFLPGFPEMAWPMVDWLLETEYADLPSAAPPVEQGFTVLEASESDLIEALTAVDAAYPDCHLSCLPQLGEVRRVELGVRGPAASVARALADLRRRLDALNLTIRDWH